MKLRAIVFCVIVPVLTVACVSYAEPTSKEKGKSPDRRSAVGLSLAGGKDSYQSSMLVFDWGLDPDWQLNFSAGTEKSNGVQTASSLQIGANTYLGESWRLKFGFIGRKEPDDVYASGLKVGTGWIVSDLWDGDLATEITLDGSFQQYRQGKDRLIQRLRGTVVPYNSVAFGVSQELSASVQALVSFTGYGYGGSSPEELATAMSNRLVVPTGLLQLLDGVPKSTFDLGAVILVSDFMFSPMLSFSTLAYDVKTSGFSLSTDYAINRSWSLSLDLASSSSSTGSKNGLLGLGVTYQW